MAKAKVIHEQRLEMSNTFAAIRQKIADAQVAIRRLNKKTVDLEEQKAESDRRYEEAHAKCVQLRNQIADRERDLFDAENQIPMAKARMHELESMCGENKHFEKVLERTRKEVTDLEKRKDEVHHLAKQKAEDCWQATQKLHKLEVRSEEVDKSIDFAFRRIMVAQERISAVEAQSNTVSKNYEELSKNEMEKKCYEKQLMVSQAKERRKASEERAMKLSLEAEELERQKDMYHGKLLDMFSGQRELASSKLL